MMRTIVDIPEDHVKALDSIGKKNDLSRTELVRRAIADYLNTETEKAGSDIDKYFGLFKDDPDVFGGMDGLSYQRKMRAEWEGRDASIDQRLERYGGFHEGKQRGFDE